MQFYSSGKLMITGEYAVLHGASALAMATKQGQYLQVEEAPNFIEWHAYDVDASQWFQATINPVDCNIIETSSNGIAERLVHFLEYIFECKPKLRRAWKFTSTLEFNRNWGLGSSSTFIANLAKWSGVEAFDLMRSVYIGSGYDVAVAMENHALVYQLNKIDRPDYRKVTWNPPFSSNLFFVYLGQKQDSAAEVLKEEKRKINAIDIDEINDITEGILSCDNIINFSLLVRQHELILANHLQRQTIKFKLFRDYPYAIKSLGAWGGDFILVVGGEHDKAYFIEKGYSTVVDFGEMVQSTAD